MSETNDAATKPDYLEIGGVEFTFRTTPLETWLRDGDGPPSQVDGVVDHERLDILVPTGGAGPDVALRAARLVAKAVDEQQRAKAAAAKQAAREGNPRELRVRLVDRPFYSKDGKRYAGDILPDGTLAVCATAPRSLVARAIQQYLADAKADGAKPTGGFWVELVPRWFYSKKGERSVSRLTDEGGLEVSSLATPEWQSTAIRLFLEQRAAKAAAAGKQQQPRTED